MTTSNVLQPDLAEVSALIASSIRHSVTQSEEEARFLIDYIAGCLDAWARDPGQSIHLKYTLGHAIGGIILVKKYWNLQLLYVDLVDIRFVRATQLAARCAMAGRRRCRRARVGLWGFPQPCHPERCQRGTQPT